MKLERKKEVIYVALSFFTAITGLTWVQSAYNDPSFVFAWSPGEWLTVSAISLVYVIAQTLVTWKAYLSDPKSLDEHIEDVKDRKTP